MSFCFVWSGRGTVKMNDQPVALRPGIVLITCQGRTFEQIEEPTQRVGMTTIGFELRDENGGELSDAPELLPAVLEVANVPYVDAVTRRVVELLRATAPRPSDSAELAVPTQLFGALLRDLDGERSSSTDPLPGTERRHTQLASEAAHRINESPQDAPSLEELSQHAGYTKDHFARVFKKVVGQTPHDYLINARVRRARQLLLESNLSIKEIASALGYRDIYFFSRQFKAKMGMTPSEARRRGVAR